MVCLGNICRSPMAEGILRDKIQKANKTAIVDSAGTSDYHMGDPPDLRAVKTLSNKGIDISGLSARNFTIKDFDDFDEIYAMDFSNYMNIISKARNESDKKKVSMIMDVVSPGNNRSVPDPFYGGLDGFEEVFELLDDAAKRIVEKL
jgi:protein-tyrosine phosphatase